MARKRQIDPDFFSDEDMAELNPIGRLGYIGLWCFVEDTGVFELRFRKLQAQIFPYDDVEFEPIYRKLVELGKVSEYEEGGRKYAFIKSFHRRQKIQHPSNSQLPLPPEPYRHSIPENIRQRNQFKKLKENYGNSTVEVNEDSHRIELNRIEEKREEEKGEEKKEIFNNSVIQEKDIGYLKECFDTYDKLSAHLDMREVNKDERDRILKQCFDCY